MARLYEWEVFMTDEDRENWRFADERLEFHKLNAANEAHIKDGIRRRCVQRARNALNKQLRAEHREKSNAV